MIHVKEISGQREMKQFVKFPFSLYKGNPYWIPPIIKDELESLNKEINPVFEIATARFFLAYKNDTIVGRVAAIINTYEIDKQNIKKMRFGWFEAIDDLDVTKALLTKVQEIGKENKLEYVEGPVGFTNLDKVGVLTEGFDQLGTMITWYSMPYYKDHFEALGYKKEKGYYEKTFTLSEEDIQHFSKASRIVTRRSKVKIKTFTRTKDIIPYADEMFQLFSETYSKLSSYVPISDEQVEFFKKKYLSFINPEFIVFVVDENDKMVAFAITMPSFGKALQKANGKLFPFGIFHLLKARKKVNSATLYLIGIHPDYQNKGVTALIIDYLGRVFLKRGITTCLRTPELEENLAIDLMWKNFDNKLRARRSTYRLNL